jgi:Rod binding domain-containing protein
MSLDFSLASINPASSIDLSPSTMAGASESAKIKQVSKAMESLFVNQLTAELGKSIDGKDDATEGPYGDFIQQAMTQGVTKGGGLGLAKIIEDSLTHNHAAKLNLQLKDASTHVNPID